MEKGFDWVWNVVPQLSAYQLFIAIVSGYVAFIGNVSREKNEKVDGQVFNQGVLINIKHFLKLRHNC